MKRSNVQRFDKRMEKGGKERSGAAAFGGGCSDRSASDLSRSFGGGRDMDGRDDDSFKRDGLSDFGSSVSGGFGRAGGLPGRSKYRDAISELYDEDEKDAVFRSSMKKGGAVREFNATFKVPTRPEAEAKMQATSGFGATGKENQQP